MWKKPKQQTHSICTSETFITKRWIFPHLITLPLALAMLYDSVLKRQEFFLGRLATNLHVAPPNYILYQNSSSRQLAPFNIPTMQPQLSPLKDKDWRAEVSFSSVCYVIPTTCFKGLIPHQRTLVGSAAHSSILPAKAPFRIAACAMLYVLPHYPREEKHERDLSMLLQPIVPQSIPNWRYKLGLYTGTYNLYLPLTLAKYLENITNFKNQTGNKYLLYPPTC